MTQKLKIAFMGTPDYVLPLLDMLRTHPACDLVAVYCQPPRPKGRGKQLQNAPTHLYAMDHNIPVYTPANFKDAADQEQLRNLDLDLAVVAAYGMLLPQSILDTPKHGCINVHPSLLPRWRGTSPLQFALWKGDQDTGVSVMHLVKKMDAGPVIATAPLPIESDTTFETLNEKAWAAGAKLVAQTIDTLAQTGTIKSTPQDESGVTLAHLLTKEDGRIDWTQTAAQIDRQIRGLNPWPGTWCFTPDGKRLKILKATIPDQTVQASPGHILEKGIIACGNQTALQILTLQPEGKKPMDVASAMNGQAIKTGDVLK